MAIVINGTTGITATESSSVLGDGAVEAADLASGAAASNLGSGSVTADKLASTLDLTGKTVTLPSGTGGKILQVVQTVKSDKYSVLTNSWTDIPGMSVSITPTSASSKILLTVYMNGIVIATSGSYGGLLRIVRDSTAIALGNAEGSRQVATGSFGGQDNGPFSQSTTMYYLDSPSTTSATTYKIQLKHTQTKEMVVNRAYQDSDNSTYGARFISTITAMEISA